ncbi:MAG: hypothetical protein QM706_07225 [Nitrospira sp.]
MTTNGFVLPSRSPPTHVDLQSANEAQAEAPVLNSQPMSALFPRHEQKEEAGKRSYRLPDSLCNGALKPFTIVDVRVSSPAGDRHVGRRDRTRYEPSCGVAGYLN